MILELYHVRTAFLIAAMVFTIMPLITWVSLLREKSRAVNVWTAGSLTTSAGLYLIGLRYEIPDVFSFALGVMLALLGNALHLQALNLEDGGQRRSWPWIAGALTVGLIKEWVRLEAPDSQWHFMLGYGCLVIIWSRSAYVAWHVSRVENSRAAQWVAGMHLIAVLIFAWRFSRSGLGMSEGNAIEQGFDGILTTLTVIFISIITHVAIIGLYLERAHRKAMQAELERERNRLNAELTSEIASLDRQRSMGELAAGLAHELGQPITGLIMDSGALQHALKRTELRTQELASIAQSMAGQAERASQILQGIRGFIQPSSTHFTTVNLVDVVHRVINLLEPWITHRNIDVSISTPPQGALMQGDAVQLSQVLLNLMRNSIQARRPDLHLRLTIRIELTPGHVSLTLEDNGRGMSDEQLRQFGTPFWTTKSDGMGIGIAISRRIIAHHEGTLTAQHPASGSGLSLVMRFPAHSK